MAQMTSHERFSRMFKHQVADRVPIIDEPWGATIERWQAEGMPKDVDWVDYFDIDHVAGIGANNSPLYPVKTLEETEQYRIHTSAWGVTMKSWKHAGGTPEFMDFTIVDEASWKEAKKRMTPTRDRINWARLEKEYKGWREKGYWIRANFWFGFDITHSWTVGTERLLMALVESPEWCMDMFNTELDMNLRLFDMIWEAGYHFDEIMWPDDLGYKNNQFMSLNMYRQLLKPVMKRACDWAHAKGVYTHLHSCGDVNPFVPEFIEIGIDALNPLEVKAGMDGAYLKKTFGDKLVLHGGLNAVLWDDFDKFAAQMERLVPIFKANGGYILSSDHSVPNSVPLETFRRTIELAKKLGSYE